jgi:hypothetical protein
MSINLIPNKYLSIIKSTKNSISTNDIYAVKDNINKIKNIPYQYLPIIFQNLFLFSCSKNKLEIIKILNTEFYNFDKITQISLRHLFFHGKYKLDKTNHEWYNINILNSKKLIN